MHILDRLDIPIRVQGNTILLKDDNYTLKNKNFKKCLLFSKSSKFIKNYIKLMTGIAETPKSLAIYPNMDIIAINPRNPHVEDKSAAIDIHTCFNNYRVKIRKFKDKTLEKLLDGIIDENKMVQLVRELEEYPDINSWDDINYNERLDNLIKKIIIYISYLDPDLEFGMAGGRRILNYKYILVK